MSDDSNGRSAKPTLLERLSAFLSREPDDGRRSDAPHPSASASRDSRSISRIGHARWSMRLTSGCESRSEWCRAADPLCACSDSYCLPALMAASRRARASGISAVVITPRSPSGLPTMLSTYFAVSTSMVTSALARDLNVISVDMDSPFPEDRKAEA
jgi:hypothetical protein